MPTLQEIRCKLLSLYGMANAFRLIDVAPLQPQEDAVGQLKAAKETGKILADTLLSIVWQIPKLPALPAVRHMCGIQFLALIDLVDEYKYLRDLLYSTAGPVNHVLEIEERLLRIYAAAAANIWV